MFESANSLARRAEATLDELDRGGRHVASVARLRERFRDAAYSPLRPSVYYGEPLLRKRDREAVGDLTDESPGKYLRWPLRAVWWSWVSASCIIAPVFLMGCASTGRFFVAAIRTTLLAEVWSLIGACLALMIWAGLKLLFPVAPPTEDGTGAGREQTAASTFFLAFSTATAALSGIVCFIWPEPELGYAAFWLWLVIPGCGGFSAGGFVVLLELGVHARRRAMLREVIRRADGLLSAGDAGGAEGEADAEPAPAAPDLPPHVAALARLAGRLAKADGRVTPSEIAAAEEMVGRLGLPTGGREAFIAEFGRGKRGGDIETELAALREHFDRVGDGGYTPKSAFFDLFMIARADGHVGPAEEALLWRAAAAVGGGTFDPQPLREMIEQVNADSPYDALGLTPPCTRDEAKRAHRKKAAELHPDKLRHQNIPEEMRAFAESRYRAVNEAYETIKGDLQ